MKKIISAALAVMLSATAVLADVAPPAQPPGSNIAPGKATNVVMSAEYVELVIEARAPGSNKHLGLAGDNTQARVSATFTMTNRGASAERLAVRFPLSDPSGRSDGFFRYPEIQGFAANVDGRKLTTRVAPVAATKANPDRSGVNWATFDVIFPSRSDTVIRVSYTLSATGYTPEASFYYVLQTGAGWRGPIGQATIVARLPYAATPDNVIPSRNGPKPSVFSGNEVHWVFHAFEPAPKDDIRFTVIEPKQWQAILGARAAVAANPGDGERLLELARAYYRAIFIKYEPSANTAQFVEPAKASFRAGLKILPKSARTLVEFARMLRDLLPNPAGYAAEADAQNVEEVIGLLDDALEIDPDSAAARETLLEVDRDLLYWRQNTTERQWLMRIEAARERVASIAKRVSLPLPPEPTLAPTPESKG